MDIILSIKPKYAALIYSGKKTWEFRKSFAKSYPIDRVWLYETKPISKITGCFRFSMALHVPVEAMLDDISCVMMGGIKLSELKKYFNGYNRGYAIAVKSPMRLREALTLKDFGINHAPQNFVYTKTGG